MAVLVLCMDLSVMRALLVLCVVMGVVVCPSTSPSELQLELCERWGVRTIEGSVPTAMLAFASLCRCYCDSWRDCVVMSTQTLHDLHARCLIVILITARAL